MAIVEMKKLSLCGMNAERNAVFDALAETGAVQIVALPEASGAVTADRDGLLAQSSRIAEAVEWVSDAAHEQHVKLPDTYRTVSLREFLQNAEHEQEFDAELDAILGEKSEVSRLATQNNRLNNVWNAVRVYAPFDIRFCDCVTTARTVVKLGTVTEEGARRLADAWDGETPVSVSLGAAYGQNVPVFLLAHGSMAEQVEQVLAEAGFSPCGFDDEATPAQKLDALRAEIEQNEERMRALRVGAAERSKTLGALVTYGDYVAYCLQKADAEQGLIATKRTYALQAYVPTDAVERVKEQLAAVTQDCWYEFTDPTEEDEVPTLLRNNPVATQYESVVNMYAAPSYTEIDPSFVMAIFFAVFFGFIMADIGYGILLILGAFLMAGRMKRDTGTRRLVYVIGTGGIFTLVFGVLFGSFFGIGHDFWSVVPPAVMPDPIEDSQTLLIYTLIAGAVQILVSFVLNGLKGLKRGSVVSFIFDGLVWAVFFVGLILLMWQMLPSLLGATVPLMPGTVTTVALCTCGGTLLIEIVYAAVRGKGFGRFTKAFGAVYGLINFMSDILSYARLYGLMLSGAIIANIVSEMSLQMMTSVGGVVGGILILAIGHAFNLAMGVLGAYVHDLRLQYIEFFSRFYEGEGELFRPLGSALQYTTITR